MRDGDGDVCCEKEERKMSDASKEEGWKPEEETNLPKRGGWGEFEKRERYA